MSRIIEITGDDFRERLQGEHAFDITNGSIDNHRLGNPSSMTAVNHPEEIGWQIPSRGFYPNGNRTAYMLYNSLPEDQREVPTYVITTPTSLGGESDFNPNGHNPIIQYISYPCPIKIIGCIFKNEVQLEYIKSDFDIEFLDCVFEKDLRLILNNFKEISFLNCTFSNISLLDIECRSLVLRDCIFLNLTLHESSIDYIKMFSLYNVSGKNLTFHGDKHTVLRLDNPSIDTINIREPNSIYHNTFFDNRLQKVHFRKIIIRVQKGSNFDLFLEYLSTDFLEINGYLGASLYLKDISTKNFSIKNFVNDGRFRLHNLIINKYGRVEISDCQLGKAEFNYVNLENAEYFSIYLSSISEIIMNNTSFPLNIVGLDENDHWGIREIYRQIKNSASKQGDRISELRYEKIEMNALERAYTTSQLEGSWTDRLILLTNKHTNAHGQHWLRALKVLIISTIMIYTALKLEVTTNYADHPYTLKSLAQYLNFALNPLHKIREIFPESSDTHITALAEVLDVFGKLFSGYMIFQFLRAFRKFAK